MRQSYTEAFELFRDAAEKGHVGAQDSLGLAYAMGRGVEQSYTEAFKWFRAAAEKGDANAQYNLGLLYFKGSVSNFVSALNSYLWNPGSCQAL